MRLGKLLPTLAIEDRVHFGAVAVDEVRPREQLGRRPRWSIRRRKAHGGARSEEALDREFSRTPPDRRADREMRGVIRRRPGDGVRGATKQSDEQGGIAAASEIGKASDHPARPDEIARLLAVGCDARVGQKRMGPGRRLRRAGSSDPDVG